MENPTLTGLLTSAAGEFPSRRALSVSGKLDLTYARLQELIESAASRLVAAGVSVGDVVALVFPNTVEVLFILMISLIFFPFFFLMSLVVEKRRVKKQEEETISFFPLLSSFSFLI
jgi:non-ribosomal peptide synthetase component E (peptide arylation enzyme)